MLFADRHRRELKDCDADASVVTISISTTRMASENYGFMAPVKAALIHRSCSSQSRSASSLASVSTPSPRAAENLGPAGIGIRRLTFLPSKSPPEGRPDPEAADVAFLLSPFERDQCPAIVTTPACRSTTSIANRPAPAACLIVADPAAIAIPLPEVVN